MNIVEIKLYSLQIPFHLPFKHNLIIRKKSNSIILTIKTSDGVIGFGEGTPREYVSGEKMSDNILYFNTFIIPMVKNISINNIDDIRGLVALLNLSLIHI